MTRLLFVIAGDPLQLGAYSSFGFVYEEVVKFIANHDMLMQWNGSMFLNDDFSLASNCS
jgi:hypothetical protein